MGILQNLQKFRVRYGSVTELTKVPGILWHGRTELAKVTKNDVPVPQVLVALAYRTSRSSGSGYECGIELPEIPGTGMNVLQNLYISSLYGGKCPGYGLRYKA